MVLNNNTTLLAGQYFFKPSGISNARGFKQIYGKHYDSSNISSPTMSEVSIRIILTLSLMANWAIHVVDTQGAFIHHEFNDDENFGIIGLELFPSGRRFVKR